VFILLETIANYPKPERQGKCSSTWANLLFDL